MQIFLIRHATAGARRLGPADRARPLDEFGHAQAVRIRDHLGESEIKQIISSPARRCLETVAPLAAELGVTVEVDDALWEGHGAAPAMALLARVADTDHPVALCSHGDVIPRVLATLAAGGVPLRGRGCEKGSIWRLDVVDGEISAGTYVDRP